MILAIIQARMSSTRLQGKVMKTILGKPMLLLQIERVRRAKLLNELLIATSDAPEDDAIEKLCRENAITCFRGSLHDVLDRLYQAAEPYRPKHVIRLTGDCPLTDPALMDKIIEEHIRGGFDYTSNTIEPTFPDGLDVEAVKFRALEQAWNEAELPSEREHVTPFISKHSERFKLGNYKYTQDLSHLRWTVDESLDFELITKIFEALYPVKPNFTMDDVLAWLTANPEFYDFNAIYQRNEGLQKSLIDDQKYILNKKG